MKRLVLLAVALAGCRGGITPEAPVLPPPKWMDYILPITNMNDQPKLQPQQASDFWGDGRGNRPVPEGTIALGHPGVANPALYKGVDAAGKPLEQYPVEITPALLERGQKRYNTYCGPCHDRTGSGNGLVPRKGWIAPPSFHQDRIRAYTPGEFYGVISNGIRTMPGYAKQITPEDRWAIAAYAQALQRSFYAKAEDVGATGGSPQP